jgi:hypothetical protein
MTMLDRIALARAGYKKKEIEEMLADEDTKTLEQVVKEDPDLNEKEIIEEVNQEEEKEQQEDVSDKIQEELLAAFEEQKEEIANLQKQLKEAQTANTRIDMDVPSVEDKEEEIIKILMEG